MSDKGEKIKLFCFPYAGGSSISYASWKYYLNDTSGLIMMDLPGRGCRMNEPEMVDFDKVLMDFFVSVKDNITEDIPYGLFGHSMGGLFVYEIYGLLEKSKLKLPEFVIFSGCIVPQRYESRNISTWTKEAFFEFIEGLGGIPEALLKEKILMDAVLKDTRKDYVLFDDYKSSNFKIKSKGYIFEGSDDKLAYDDMEGWKNIFEKNPDQYIFPGGHFFINEAREQVCEVLNKIISKY